MNLPLHPTDPQALNLCRTQLANERTLLAYVRTALGLVAAGVTLIHFLGSPGARWSGWGLIMAGALSFLLGWWRFLRIRRRLSRSGAAR